VPKLRVDVSIITTEDMNTVTVISDRWSLMVFFEVLEGGLGGAVGRGGACGGISQLCYLRFVVTVDVVAGVLDSQALYSANSFCILGELEGLGRSSQVSWTTNRSSL